MAETNGSKKVWTTDGIRRANEAAGWAWFSEENVRLFNAEIDPEVYEGVGGVFFASSEKPPPEVKPGAPRRWTVRRFDPETGEILVHGSFYAYERHEAHAIAAAEAEGSASDPGIEEAVEKVLDNICTALGEFGGGHGEDPVAI